MSIVDIFPLSYNFVWYFLSLTHHHQTTTILYCIAIIIIFQFFDYSTKPWFLFRELNLKRDDVVYVWGVVDENWMKGEHHGSLGIFPSSYVQVEWSHFDDFF